MRLFVFIFVAVTLMVSDGFLVKGPSGPLVVALGSSVVLPCYVDEPLPLKGLTVVWIRTDINTQVHLFLNGNSRPDAQYQDYHDRAHFFTDQIKHGNFSLRLENVRAEDKAFYRCKVDSLQDAGGTFVEIKAVEYLSVSGSDDPVSAFVGEDVTLNCSVHSHIITPEHIERVSWRKIDEDENIQVLLWQRNKIQPDSSDERYRDRVQFFTDEIPKGNFSLTLKRTRHGDRGVYMCRVETEHLSANTTAVLERLGFSVLHTLILALCISASGSALLLILVYCTSQNNWKAPYLNICLNFLPNIMMFVALILWGISNGSCLEQKGKWFGLVIPVNIFMICFYIGLLNNHKDHIGWACVIGFLQIKWTLMDLTWTYNKSDCCRNTYVYLFGSVGVVLLSASTLMTELMLKIWNGGRTIDLRIVLFPVESTFALFLLILQVLTPGEAHAFKGLGRFAVMTSFFLIIVAFLLVINYIQ